MKVLLAAPDRDFLMSYQRLFELEGVETTTAFDGFQVMSFLRERALDLVVLDRDLPRVEHDKLVRMINEMKIPLIVLQGQRMDAKALLKEELADSYLVYPFLPEEFFERVKESLEKRKNGQVHQIGDIELDEAEFLLGKRIRVTNEEIDILLFLTNQEKQQKLPMKHGMYYVNALNQKLEKAGRKLRIQYKMDEGYGLVKNE